MSIVVSIPHTAEPEVEGVAGLPRWLEAKLQAPASVLTVPTFKVGSLDALLEESEELAKLDAQVHQVYTKVSEVVDSTRTERVVEAASGGLSDAPTYLSRFRWNTARYRVDRTVGDLAEAITREVLALDGDVRAVQTAHQAAQSALSTAQRASSGSLASRSLHGLVTAQDVVLGSEYLDTVFVAVPKQNRAEYEALYERLVPLVVPRSARVVAEDSEFVLFSTTLFRKHKVEFDSKCREHRWTPRDFSYSPEAAQDAASATERAARDEQRLRADLARLARAAYSDVVQAWAHLKVLRVFVESVLRYGLPPDFAAATVILPKAQMARAAKLLTEQFGFLGGSARSDADLKEYGALVEQDYTPFVYYELSF